MPRFAIRAAGPHRTCWLKYVAQEGRYRWHFGVPGRELAARFATKEEAQAVIESGYFGAAAASSEVVELEEEEQPGVTTE